MTNEIDFEEKHRIHEVMSTLMNQSRVVYSQAVDSRVPRVVRRGESQSLRLVVEAVFILEHESRRVLLDLLSEHGHESEGVAQEQHEEHVAQHIHLHTTWYSFYSNTSILTSQICFTSLLPKAFFVFHLAASISM